METKFKVGDIVKWENKAFPKQNFILIITKIRVKHSGFIFETKSLVVPLNSWYDNEFSEGSVMYAQAEVLKMNPEVIKILYSKNNTTD